MVFEFYGSVVGAFVLNNQVWCGLLNFVCAVAGFVG